MQIWVGLSTKDLTSLLHREIVLEAYPPGGTIKGSLPGFKTFEGHGAVRLKAGPAGGLPQITLADGRKFSGDCQLVSSSGKFQILSLSRAGIKGAPQYHGTIRVSGSKNALTLSLNLSLDSYLRGVLASEMPASYHEEALKGQALCARTYALHPRVPHDKDNVHVCDSYLCCQYFAGHAGSVDRRIEAAIAGTAGEILTYQQQPILALFSSNAGGHTEDYENCFSDPLTGAFPPPALPYLRGVAEGDFSSFHKGQTNSAEFLRYLYDNAAQGAAFSPDNWTPKFHFQHRFSADSLEAHMHHTVEKLMAEKDSAPYVIPPASTKFGHIKKFKAVKRGISGCLIELSVETSTGNWLFKKELVIRKLFENPEAGVKRLNSARIFFAETYSHLGLLETLSVKGLGFGHGVGFQQTGAHGLAKYRALNYKQILAHYFKDVEIEKT